MIQIKSTKYTYSELLVTIIRTVKNYIQLIRADSFAVKENGPYVIRINRHYN